MQSKPTPRTTFRPTRHRGLSWRPRRGGERTFYGYVSGRGRVRLNATAEREAVAEYGELRGKIAKGEKIAPASARFRDVAEQWYEGKTNRLRLWTLKGYRASLDKEVLPTFGHLKLRDIDVEHVARWIRKLEARGLSSSTINSHVLPLSGTFDLARRRGLMSMNPCSLLTVDDRPAKRERRQDHVWSDEEIAALIQSAEHLARQPESRYDYSSLVRVALYSGLRLGELLGLQWQDIDLQEGILRVQRQWTRTGDYAEPKTKAALRRLPLSADLTKYLAAHKLRSRFSGDDDPVFASRNGKPLSHRNVQRRGFEPAAELAGIGGVTFHSMRHAFASRMIARGIEAVTLASLMGHEDARVTLSRYVHLFDRQKTDDTIREAMAQ